MFVMGSLVLSPHGQVLSHELQHEALYGLDTGGLSDAEHQLLDSLGQCEPGLAHFSVVLAEARAHPAPVRPGTLLPRSVDLQSSFRPPRSQPA